MVQLFSLDSAWFGLKLWHIYQQFNNLASISAIHYLFSAL